MARAVLVDDSIDAFTLGWAIEDIIRCRQRPISVEEIQEALKTTVIDGEVIEATVEEIKQILEECLVQDGTVLQIEENLFSVRADQPPESNYDR